MKRSSIFEQKTMDYAVRKISIFWHLLKRLFCGLKIILFYLKYQKTIFSDMIIPKNPNEKKFDFWTKTMDYLLRKMSIF